MAISQDNIIFNETEYLKAPNPDTGALEDRSAIQTVFVKGLTTADVSTLKIAAERCDTPAEIGDPFSGGPSTFEIKQVRVRALGGGEAWVTVLWGADDWNFGPARRKSEQRAWSVPFIMKVRRYVKSVSPVVFCADGETVLMSNSNQPIYFDVDVPAMKLYILEIETSLPPALDEDYGLFASDTGYSGPTITDPAPGRTMYLGKDTKKYQVGSNNIWYDIDVLEFRSLNPEDGWIEFKVGQNSTAVEFDYTDAIA